MTSTPPTETEVPLPKEPTDNANKSPVPEPVPEPAPEREPEEERPAHVVDSENEETPAGDEAEVKPSLPEPPVVDATVASRSTPGKSTYRDYSRMLPEKVSALAAQTARAKEPTFPCKLHMIISNPEFQDIITWLPHGRSWRILQQKVFEERVIPLFFRHGRYSSFARQVNGWGFKRITHGSDYNSYYHEMFLRGMPHLCEQMRRLTAKDNAARKLTEDDVTPDFYAISRAYPLPESAATQPQGVHSLPQGLGGLPGAGLNLGMDPAAQQLLERRDLLDRMGLLAAVNPPQPQDPMAALLAGARGPAPQGFGAFGGMGGINGLQGAPPAGLAGFNPQGAYEPAPVAAQQQLNPADAAALRQILAARNQQAQDQQNADLSRLLALQGGGLQGLQGLQGGLQGLQGGLQGLQGGLQGLQGGLQGSLQGGLQGNLQGGLPGGRQSTGGMGGLPFGL